MAMRIRRDSFISLEAATPGTKSSGLPSEGQGSSESEHKKCGAGCVPENQPTNIHIISAVADYIIDLQEIGDGSYYLLHKTSETTPVGVLTAGDSATNDLTVSYQQNLPSQKWYLHATPGDPTKYAITTSTTIAEGTPCLTYTSLYKADTILAYLPYSANNQNQYWYKTTRRAYDRKTINVGTYAPSSSSGMATASQNVSGSSDSGNPNMDIDAVNNSKVKEVLEFIAQNMDAYKTAITNGSAATHSQNRDPITLNLHLNGDSAVAGANSKQPFEDVGRPTYAYVGDKVDGNDDKMGTDLEIAYKSIFSCPQHSADEYSLNRVGQCNCNLSDLFGH
jgi:hypothetical protein